MNDPPSNDDRPETQPPETRPRDARGWYVVLIAIAAIGIFSIGALVLQLASIRGSQIAWQRSLLEIEHEVERAGREHGELLRTIGDLKKRKATLEAIVDDLEQRRSNAEGQLKTASEKYAKEQSETAKAQSALAIANSEIQFIKKEINRNKARRDELAQNIRDRTAQMQKATAASKQARNEADAALKQKIQALTLQKQAEEKRDKAVVDARIDEDRLTRLGAEAAQRQGQLDALNESVAKLEAVQKQLTDLQGHTGKARSDLALVRQEITTARRTLQDLKDQQMDIREIIAKRIAERLDLVSKIDTSRQKLATVDDTQKRLAELKREKTEITTQLQRAKTKLRDAETQEKTAREAAARMQRSQSDLEMSTSSLNARKKDLEEQVSKLQATRISVETKRDAAQRDWQTIVNLIKGLRSQELILRGLVASKDELSSQVIVHRDTLKELQDSTRARRTEYARVDQSVLKAERKRENLNVQLGKLSGDQAILEKEISTLVAHKLRLERENSALNKKNRDALQSIEPKLDQFPGMGASDPRSESTSTGEEKVAPAPQDRPEAKTD